MPSKSILLFLPLLSISWALPTAASSVSHSTATNTFTAPTPATHLETTDLTHEIGMGRMNAFDFDEEKEGKMGAPPGTHGSGAHDEHFETFTHEETKRETETPAGTVQSVSYAEQVCPGCAERKLGGRDATVGDHTRPVKGKNTPHRKHDTPAAVPEAAVPASAGDFFH